MRICQTHWDKLRAALKERGLDHLGAKSGKEAVDDAVTQLSGGDTDYDPTMACFYMISSKGLEIGGLYMMGTDEQGNERCPICECVAHGAGDENFWINGPADAALAEARSRKLVPEKQ